MEGLSEAQEDGSPDSRRSQLSLDDLSSHGDDVVASADKAKALEQSTTSFGNDTTGVESKLKLNLEQQKEHYARQRQLFEELRRDSVLGLSPSAFSSSSKSEDDGDDAASFKITPHSGKSSSPVDQDESSVNLRSKKFQLHLQQLQQELKKPTDYKSSRALKPSSSERDDHESEEIERLQRKAKHIANYHSRVVNTSSSGLHYARHTSTTVAPRGRVSTSRLDENETSNEALRKQLELLRRLQLENNRFRHENRSLREQNEVLEEQTSLHTREIKRLQDEISDLSTRIQHDQLELATAAQNVRKMKQLQKQLSGLQTEKDQLQLTLQDAVDQDAQFRLRSQNEIETIVQDNKHLKRSVKQLKQHETRLQEQAEEFKSMITATEKQAAEHKRQLLESKRDSSEMATRLSEKTAHIEAIENSATQCVERMETGMEALQKAHNSEREKRKKLEKVRDQLQSEVGTLESDHSKLQDRFQELEAYNKQLQQRLQDWKLEKKQDKKFQDEKVAEFHARQRTDTKTIGNLREDCTTLEQQLETARAAIVEVRKEVAAESNSLRKEIEALRNYVEDAQRAPSPSPSLERVDDCASNERSLDAGGPLAVTLPLPRHRREELWVQLPELQFLQGAVGGLRNEMMNFVNDFHRARHQARQHAVKLTATQERVVELEHFRSEDAVARRQLEDQRILAEQAREITLQEKMEVLQWSQQACEKSERLETALAACERGVHAVVKRTRRVAAVLCPDTADRSTETTASTATVSVGDEPAVVGAVATMEREVQELISKLETLAEAHKTALQESGDRQLKIARLHREMEAQRQDHAAVVAEIETLHVRAIAEKQNHFASSLRVVEDERDELHKSLVDERQALAAIQSLNQTLEAKLHALEMDVPLFVSVLQLFALVVPPLVLQVNDLLAQKRVLTRENAEFAMAQEQVECIGQVLRELVPSAAGIDDDSFAELQRRQRRKRFRRVVIAVFAINRFQRGGFTASAGGTGGSVYGVCASLKQVKKKPSGLSASSSSSSCLPPPTVIKVLPGKPLLSRLNMRKLLDRLRGLDLTTKLCDALNGSTTAENGASFGSFLMNVLMTIDPSAKETLQENTAGTFHCRALLERRKAPGSRWHDGNRNGSDQDVVRLSTVDLIRKRILALGKRLEDLHYQRNALQKENYDFQYQIDQQADQLKEMSAVVQKNEELQDAINQLQQQQASESSVNRGKLVEKDQAIETAQLELNKHQRKILRLENEITTFESRVSELELEKTELRHVLVAAQSASAAEEEKLHKSQINLDKQAEELRNLKQAAKRAHEQHQKITWQLEQELVEKASIQSMMEHLRKQKETLELEVSKAKVRAIDDSFDGEDENNASSDESKATNHGTKLTKPNGNHLSLSSSSSSASYERHIQELTDRIAQIRTVQPLVGHNDNDSDEASSAGKGVEDAQRSAKTKIMDPDDFRNEWQRLDISRVLEDENRCDVRVETSTMRSNAHEEQEVVSSDRRRRDDEIDKVNSAVHDYMDRIDEKLEQMYGIPKSSSRQRPPSTASVVHGTTTKNPRKTAEVRWGDATEFE